MPSGRVAQPIKHGTRHAHDARGCRCEACREAVNAHVRERRARYALSGRCPYCGDPSSADGQNCDDCKATIKTAKQVREQRVATARVLQALR